MNTVSRRLIISLVAALLALGPLASIAAAWNASCDGGEACVWLHAPRVPSLAAQAADDNNYGNNVYPNTIITLHDTVSSIQNKKTTKVVIWFFDYWQGTAFCLQPGWWADYLGTHNDQYDSHLMGSGATCS